MEPNLRHIRYFIATARSGQVTRAARELNISQSAITSGIKQLEEMVGYPLFSRKSRRLQLTDNGALFLRHAERIFTAVNEALHAPRDIHASAKGDLRLAMTYTVAGYFLPRYLERFARNYPDVNVRPVEAPRTEIEAGLVSGEFDIAVILTSNIADQERLSYETLFRSTRRLWLASGHPLFERGQITLSDLTEEPFIMLTVDEAANTARRYWNEAKVRPNVIMNTSSVEAVRSMVASGMGITILSDMVYRPWSLEGQRVEAVPLVTPVPSMDVGIVWAFNAELSPATKAFAEFMRNDLSL
ncbi:MAG: LysR substrate-binding domain-containing protein [Hyphomicrobiales bacterium]|nr:LysR substrate-binding domain-containing protein [Hyphomicrobiales bacterium]MCY4049458.1 LysR substrate-binding domain-containing protein [Hyphomicrobiales bacterium]MCY4054066.1 LysR substrate-binding domain-containing protein [Hyphomicrobiales bacterium]